MRRQISTQQNLQTKINQCKELVIQSIDKNMHHKYFFKYLSQQNLQKKVNFRVNYHDGVIKLFFNSHDEAIKFYEDRNFADVVMSRRLNIYLSLSVEEQEIKRYFLKGVNEQNIRSVFESCRKYGFTRLNLMYLPKLKMKDTAILCYLRLKHLDDDQFKALFQKLKSKQVTLRVYKEKSNLSRLKNEGENSHIKQSSLKYQQKEAEINSKSKPVQNFDNQPVVLTLVTLHNEDQKITKSSEKELITALQINLDKRLQSVYIDRILVPTINPKTNKIILSRQIEFQSYPQAQQALGRMANIYRQQNFKAIIYLYHPQDTSTLIALNSQTFCVKAKEEKCVVFQRTQKQGKIIKLLQIKYKELDGCLFQKSRVKISMYKCSQIQLFGLPIDYPK